MVENLLVEESEHGSWIILAVKGEVDLETAPRLKGRLTEAVDKGTANIVVDLSEVEFLDSSGLGALIGGLRRCKEAGGNLALVNPRRPVRKVLSITGLEKVFPIYDSVEEATSA